MNRKGDLSFGVWTIVSVALLLIGFIILLFFIRSFDFTGASDTQACHQSIVLRGGLSASVGLGSNNYVPLSCYTDKICVTSGLFGGECSEYGGAKDVSYVRVDSEDEVEKVVADNIISCWEMTGQGKLSIFSQWWAEKFGTTQVYPSCVVCTRVAFDKEALTKAKIDLRKVDVNNYMGTHLFGDTGKTYSEYLAGAGGLTNQRGDFAALSQQSLDDFNADVQDPEKQRAIDAYLDENIGELSEEDKAELQTFSEELIVANSEDVQSTDTSDGEMAIIFSQISAPSHGEVFTNTITALLGYSLASGTKPDLITKSKAPLKYPKGTIIDGKKVGGQFMKGGRATTLGRSAQIVAFAFAVEQIYAQGQVGAGREKAAAVCGDVKFGEDSREGCSIVRTIDYSADDIGRYCAVVESIG